MWSFDDTQSSIAKRVLANAGYAIGTADLPSGPLDIAEDAYSIIGILSVADWAAAARVIPEMQLDLANWAADRGAGPRQWDLYLVSLVQSAIDNSELDEVEHVIGDTHYVRKIVRANVLPEPAAMARALAPFLPIETEAATAAEPPLGLLAARLRSEGVDPATIAAATDSFSRSGQVDIP